MQRTDVLRRIESTDQEIVTRILSQEWRFEALRQALRRELRTHSGQRQLASMIGVSRSVIRKFLELRSIPTPENLATLEAWSEDRPAVSVPAGAVCVALLAGDLEPCLRSRARSRLAEALAEIYRDSIHPVPAWVRNELSDRTGE